MDKVKKQYDLWTKFANEDIELVNELAQIKDNPELIRDAFYKDLEFGTGGLRGVLGAGTNRMNIYTIRKFSQAISNQLISNNLNKKNNLSIAISYDSRKNSRLFAETAAQIFASNNIKVYLYKVLMPTPLLSWAVRYLHTDAGVMITASHNPSKYNGYKVYGSDGCQITEKVAEQVTNEANKIEPLEITLKHSFEELMKEGLVEYISEEVVTAFIERVKKESLLSKEDKINKDVTIVYTPLHGTGLKPVTRILKESGYNNVIVVKEQELPDSEFTTCPYPNPEIKEAMALGIEYAKKYDADLLVATDPDCDRVGIATKNSSGEFVLLTGNETGILLADYIGYMRNKNHTMPVDPVMVKTIVTTDMIYPIAKNYGITVKNVLTGFKYIGDQIALLEKDHKESSYILGFEESYGYLTGSYVRDKDAVDGVYLIIEMFVYYKTHGISLLDKLEELYKKYGYYANSLKSYQFEGESGFNKMNEIMNYFRNDVTHIGKFKVINLLDYAKGVDGLPLSNVIKLQLDNEAGIVIRPSGTEPKLKVYISSKANSELENKELSNYLFTEVEKLLK